jgi:hypothetical protein
MNIIKIALAVVITIFSVSCSHFSTESQPVGQNKSAIISDISINKGFIRFSTTGYGCTFYNNFKVVKSKRHVNEIEVLQLTKDECSMTPRKIDLVYSIRHLELNFDKRIFVKNMPSDEIENNIAAGN